MQEVFTEEEMAKILNKKISTLRKDRSNGTDHPPFQPLSRNSVVYPRSKFQEWCEKRTVHSDRARRRAS